MATVPIFVGLDYSDQVVEVAVLDGQGSVLSNRPIANVAADLDRHVRQFGSVIRAGIECGTGAANLAEELSSRFQWSIDMAHSGIVNHMKQNPDKTDFQDARLVADLVRVGYLPRVWLPPERIRELRRLVRYREELVAQRRQAKQRLRAIVRDARQKPASPATKPWTQAWWVWLEQIAQFGSESRWVLMQHKREIERKTADIATVEKRLAEVTRDDVVVQKLLKQRGIGPVTSWTLRAEIGNFERFNNGKQLARYCGVSPCNASSGQRKADAGLIKAANGSLRTVLIELAHRLARLEPRWVQFKVQKKKEGKAGSVIAGAIANRWVRKLYYVMTEKAEAA
jgi:transposase